MTHSHERTTIGEIIFNKSAKISLRRRTLCRVGLSIFLVSACDAKPMRVSLNISLFSYLDRPIYDVAMNGTSFMSAMEHSFFGANGLMVMQPINLGVQIVTWRLGGPEGMLKNGELVTAINRPLLDAVPKDVKWLALHIYDDDSVEIKLSKGSPDELQTQRGRKIIDAWELKNGH